MLGTWNTTSSSALPTAVTLITNADQGVLATWRLQTGTGSSGSSTFYIATTSGTSLASRNTMPQQITPVLQAQDGTFYGTDANGNMVKFDQTGHVFWTVPNDSAQIATADGGVIGVSGATYDANGNATGQVGTPIQSWTGEESESAYQYGSVKQVQYAPPIMYAVPPTWSFAGANQSKSKTSALCHDNRDKLIAEYPKYGAGYIPVCFASEFVPSSNTSPVPDFSFSTLNQDDNTFNDYADWAMLRSSMLTGLERASVQSIGLRRSVRVLAFPS